MPQIPISTVNAAVGPIAKLLEASAKGIRGIPALIRKQSELADFMGNVSARYSTYSQDVYRNIRILSMSKPVELQQIYTQVRLEAGLSRVKLATEKEILNEIIHKTHALEEKIAAQDVAKSENRVVILGRPGSGKSTFLKYFLISQIRNEEHLKQIPILVQLNQFGNKSESIISQIEKILEYCGVEFSQDLTRSLMEKGRLKILVDGLDEIRDAERNVVVSEINMISRKYRDCDLIITCRSAAYEFWFEDFNHYEIEAFGLHEIGYFVENWFDGDPVRAAQLKDQIFGSLRLKDLCSNPLMLTIVCVGFEGNSDVSNNRAEIYKDAVDALLRKWDTTRSVYRDNYYREITPKRREDLLSDLAARTFVNSEIVFPEARAVDIIGKFLATIPAPEDRHLAEEATGVLNSIESQHGLVEKRSTNLWTFSHLTFQEFFVSRFLAYRDEDLRSNIVRKYIDKPEWREIIMLTAGLLPNADEYILDMLRAMSKIGFGSFFLRQVENEIGEARKSIDHRNHDAEEIFGARREAEALERAKSMNLRIVDGGVRLDLADTRSALDRFRVTAARRLGGGISGFFWGSTHLLNRGDLGDIEEVKSMGAIISSYPRRISDPWFRERSVMSVAAQVISSHSLVDHFNVKDDDRKPDFGVSMMVARAIAHRYVSVLLDTNEDLESKLNAALSPEALFELTDRRYMYVVPDCVDDCVKAARKIVDGISFSEAEKEIERLKIFSSDSIWVARQYTNVLRAAISTELDHLMRQISELNALESAKLRAFIAGETLAEVLLSQVFLTPRVREAAIKTLDNLVNNVPQPPDGPESFDAAARARTG